MNHGPGYGFSSHSTRLLTSLFLLFPFLLERNLIRIYEAEQTKELLS
jgi:hypothetical protein